MGVTTTDRLNIECEHDCPCQEVWELLAAVGCDADRTIARLLRPCPWTDASQSYNAHLAWRNRADVLTEALANLIADSVAASYNEVDMPTLPGARRALTGTDSMGGDR